MQTDKLNYFSDAEQSYFEEIQNALGGFETDEAGTLASINIDELCERYNQIRGTIELALKAVEKIPGIGKKIAKAIRFLMTVADFACSSGGDPNAFTSGAESESGISLSLEQIEALDRLEAAVDSTAALSFAASDMVLAASFDKDEICRQYRKVRKFIKPVLPIINMIPGVGGTIVTAINILMAIADSVCGE